MKIRPRGATEGFTLIELMIVVAIIGILAAVAIPKFLNFIEKTKIARAANDLKIIVKGFELYALEQTSDGNNVNRGYPDDTHRVLPAGVEAYVNEATFTKNTVLGGYWNWEGPDSYPYAGMAFESSPKGDDLFVLLDQKIDDGDLATGEFQKTANGRYTWLLWVK